MITLSANLKMSEQCGIAALKINRILRLIRRHSDYHIAMLEIIQLTLLEAKRNRRDQIKVNEMMYGFEDRSQSKFVKVNKTSVTRGLNDQ